MRDSYQRPAGGSHLAPASSRLVSCMPANLQAGGGIPFRSAPGQAEAVLDGDARTARRPISPVTPSCAMGLGLGLPNYCTPVQYTSAGRGS
jgi:hypothetical protein